MRKPARVPSPYNTAIGGVTYKGRPVRPAPDTGADGCHGHPGAPEPTLEGTCTACGRQIGAGRPGSSLCEACGTLA